MSAQARNRLNAEIEVKKLELKTLNDTIIERRKYFSDQEKLITDLVEAGNTQLMGLIHDTELAKKELRDLKTDIRTAAQDKVILNEDLEDLRQQIGSVHNRLSAVPVFG